MVSMPPQADGVEFVVRPVGADDPYPTQRLGDRSALGRNRLPEPDAHRPPNQSSTIPDGRVLLTDTSEVLGFHIRHWSAARSVC